MQRTNLVCWRVSCGRPNDSDDAGRYCRACQKFFAEQSRRINSGPKKEGRIKVMVGQNNRRKFNDKNS